MKIRLLVADDHPLVSAGIGAMLDAVPDMTLVGRTSTDDVVAAASQSAADLVVIDPPAGPMEIIAKLAARGDVRVLVMTERHNVRSIRDALLSGAGGYILKANAARLLLSAVRAVASRGILLDPDIVSDLVDDLAARPIAGRANFPSALTARETEVLLCMAEGLSDACIGERLSISVLTVRTHVSRVLMKLCARNRAHAVTLAYRIGLIKILTQPHSEVLPSSSGGPRSGLDSVRLARE